MPAMCMPIQSSEISWETARKHDYLDDIPTSLVEALRNGKCVAMVGAGLSRPAGLPGYEELLRVVAERAGIPVQLPPSGSYDDLDKIQFQLVEQVGRVDMCKILRSQLYVEEPIPDAMQIVLEAFCNVPFAAVVSWNWDNILDSRYQLVPNNSSGFDTVLKSALSGSYHATSTPLVKMQGDFDDSATVLMSEDDYRQSHDGRIDFLKHVYQNYVVLHIGLSLRRGGVGDERRAGARHYAILNDVDPERRRELESWNIHAINYDSKATSWRGNEIIMAELAERAHAGTES